MFLIILSTFVCFTLGALAIYWTMFRPASAATERLRRMNEAERGMGASAITLAAPAMDGPGATLAARVAKPLHKLAPPSAAEAAKLQKQLMQAGYRAQSAPL